MRKSKFIRVLKTLDKQELSVFSQYLKNLYPKKRVQHQLFDFIKSFKPEYNHVRLNHKEVLVKVFKEQTEDTKKIIDTLSDLYLLLMEFLMWQENKKRSIGNSIEKIRILKCRNLDLLAWQVLKKTKKELDKCLVKDEWYFLNQFLLTYELFYSSRPVALQEANKQLQNYMEYLDLFFAISKLKLIVEAKSRENILGRQETIHFLEQIRTDLEREDQAPVLLLKVYSQIIQLIEHGKPDKYNALKTVILENYKNLSRRDFKNILTYLINFSAHEIRRGNTSFFKEVFELSKFGIEQNVLFENHHIPASRFINLIDAACYLNEIEWANIFSDKYANFLDASIRENTLTVTKARINFALSSFDKVIHLLRKHSFRNIYFELRARTLLLRSYVEIYKDKDFILSFCTAFEQYLRRKNELSDSILTGYHNFIKIIKHIVKCKKSKHDLQKIKTDMVELVCKDWIDNKLEKYEPII